MKRISKVLLVVGAVVCAAPAFSQTGGTLQDLHSEIDLLGRQIGDLRAQLLQSAQTLAPVEAATALQRLNDLEARLGQAVGRLETIEYDLDQAIAEAEDRLADLDRRLTALEGGDPAAVEQGGANDAAAGLTPETPQLATREQGDFDAAFASYQAEDYEGAAALFGSFVANYPQGPLTPRAQYLQAQSLAALTDWLAAAKLYLDIFSSAPESDLAPLSLLGFARALGAMDQVSQACLTLDEVQLRYAAHQADVAADVVTEKQNLACP